MVTVRPSSVWPFALHAITASSGVATVNMPKPLERPESLSTTTAASSGTT